MSGTDYVIRPSSRRTRSVTAFREGGTIVVVVPAALSERQRRTLAPGLVEQFLRKEERSRPPRAEQALTERACELWDAHLAGVAGCERPPFGVRWSTAQQARWGSCTASTGEIRVSSRLRELPGWVLDYVLVHEMVHLLEHDHSSRFWRLVDAFPGTTRARGFLEGVDHVTAHGLPPG